MSQPNDRLLICFDGSAGSRLAIETAGKLFPGRTATVLHVWTPMAVTAFAYGAMMVPAIDEDAVVRAALEVAEHGAALAKDAGLIATAATAEGTFDGTWRVIVEYADANDVALIVIGARGLSAFQSMILGSISHGVVQHATCPVLVVPPPVPAEKTPVPAEKPAAAVTGTTVVV